MILLVLLKQYRGIVPANRGIVVSFLNGYFFLSFNFNFNSKERAPLRDSSSDSKNIIVKLRILTCRADLCASARMSQELEQQLVRLRSTMRALWGWEEAESCLEQPVVVPVVVLAREEESCRSMDCRRELPAACPLPGVASSGSQRSGGPVGSLDELHSRLVPGEDSGFD